MARPVSDVELRRLYVEGGRKRSRKNRKKPDPPANLKQTEAEAEAFVRSLPLSPGVVTEEQGDSWQVQSPHSDDNLWQLQLTQAFGTRSTSLLQTFLRQLAALCPQSWDADRQVWRENETTWNALLALVSDHQPENSAQAALAAQMAATHLMVMKLSEQALNRGHTVMEKDAALVSKLARTFAVQCETMQALKGKVRTTRQSVHVTKETHQHVHYHDDQGGLVENANQSQGRGAASPDKRQALWSEEPGREALPRPGRDGEGTLPISRRKSRSAERQG
ncbi:MAG: hypothetical protein V7650_05045 [Parasphingorhabdus sp.]